jgi:hypothetical protein
MNESARQRALEETRQRAAQQQAAREEADRLARQRAKAEADAKKRALERAEKANPTLQKVKEKATEVVKEKVKDVLKEQLSKLLPGVNVAAAGTEFVQDVVTRQTRLLGDSTLKRNPGSKLLIEERSFTGPTSTGLDYAGSGNTVWQDKNGVWYFSKNPNYEPKTGYTQLFRPSADRGDGNPGIRVVQGTQVIDEASSKARSAAANKALKEETVGKLTDFFKGKAKEEAEKLVPGAGHAFDAHEALTKAVKEHREEMARPTLARNPGAELVSSRDAFANPTSAAQHQATKGHTAWRDNQGIWYVSDRPDYVPKTGYTEIYRPAVKGPDGVWQWKLEKGKP